MLLTDVCPWTAVEGNSPRINFLALELWLVEDLEVDIPGTVVGGSIVLESHVGCQYTVLVFG